MKIRAHNTSITAMVGEGEGSVSYSACFTSRKRTSDILCSLDKRLRGLQRKSGRAGEEKHPCSYGKRDSGIQPIDPIALMVELHQHLEGLRKPTESLVNKSNTGAKRTGYLASTS